MVSNTSSSACMSVLADGSQMREDHLIGLRNLTGVRLDRRTTRHSPPRPRPSVLLVAVFGHAEEHVRRGQRRDLDALARKVENDGTGDGGAGRRRRRRRRRIVRLYLNFVGAGGRGGIIGDQSSRQAPRTRRRGQGRRDVQIWHRRELLVKPVSRIRKTREGRLLIRGVVDRWERLGRSVIDGSGESRIVWINRL